MKTVYGESDAALGAAASEKRMAPSGQQPPRLGPCPRWGAVGPLTQTVLPAGKERREHGQAGLTVVTELWGACGGSRVWVPIQKQSPG